MSPYSREQIIGMNTYPHKPSYFIYIQLEHSLTCRNWSRIENCQFLFNQDVRLITFYKDLSHPTSTSCVLTCMPFRVRAYAIIIPATDKFSVHQLSTKDILISGCMNHNTNITHPTLYPVPASIIQQAIDNLGQRVTEQLGHLLTSPDPEQAEDFEFMPVMLPVREVLVKEEPWLQT